MTNATKLAAQLGVLGDIKMDYLVGSRQRNQWLENKTVTLAGAAPHAITFASLSLPNMEDADYNVLVSGDSGAQLDAASRAVTGFSLVDGADTNVVVLTIIGAPLDKR